MVCGLLFMQTRYEFTRLSLYRLVTFFNSGVRRISIIRNSEYF